VAAQPPSDATAAARQLTAQSGMAALAKPEMARIARVEYEYFMLII